MPDLQCTFTGLRTEKTLLNMKWIELKKQLPEESELLVWGTLQGDDEPNIHMVSFYDDTLAFHLCGDSSERIVLSVKYWMPLPPAPTL